MRGIFKQNSHAFIIKDDDDEEYIANPRYLGPPKSESSTETSQAPAVDHDKDFDLGLALANSQN